MLQGAAVTDGRLRAGDRLVSVNKISVSGLTQQQVVSLLRTTPTDSTVEIVVERNAPHRTQVSCLNSIPYAFAVSKRGYLKKYLCPTTHYKRPISLNLSRF